MLKLPGVSLCTFVKNEAHCIEHMLKPIANIVGEIVVVDTGSTDNTLEIAAQYTDRIYQVGFTSFDKIRTLTSHLARRPWVLMLDADETISNIDQLQDLMMFGKEAYAIPRKRWLDLEMTQQTELEAYPDLQVRFYQNRLHYVWKRELHEYFHGGTVENLNPNIWKIQINHFQDVFKDQSRKQIRDELYSKLAPIAKVTIEGGHEISN